MKALSLKELSKLYILESIVKENEQEFEKLQTAEEKAEFINKMLHKEAKKQIVECISEIKRTTDELKELVGPFIEMKE